MKSIVFLLILLVISSEITFDVKGGPDEGGPHADSVSYELNLKSNLMYCQYSIKFSMNEKTWNHKTIKDTNRMNSKLCFSIIHFHSILSGQLYRNIIISFYLHYLSPISVK
ncbi:unnamed protein product [Schistosoma intercalatum]|nr:unnamed protein product [Schistosoma intercalatum]